MAGRTLFQNVVRVWPAARALQYSDFRLMWLGTFLSFFGSQIQLVAQGDYVWQLTHDQAMLARVGVLGMLPGTFLFPIVGFIVDVYDRRVVMTVCMVVMAVGSATLGFVVWNGTAAYWHFAVVSLVSGVFSTMEMPTRQSIVRECVPAEDIGNAVPLQAMTFNLSRVVGPAVAAYILLFLNSSLCFFLNAVSFVALIWAPWVVKADLRAAGRRRESVKDLIFEGVLYTLRHSSLRKFFVLESATSLLAVFYINQLPAYVDTVLHLPRAALGYATGAVGAGAMVGLIFLGFVSDRRIKSLIVRCAVSVVALSLTGLGSNPSPVLAFVLLGCMGAGTITQFNTTNATFQMTAPARLKGRVLTMHFWALAGLAPVGLLVFGETARRLGLAPTLAVAGCALALVALWGWSLGLESTDPLPDREPGAA